MSARVPRTAVQSSATGFCVCSPWSHVYILRIMYAETVDVASPVHRKSRCGTMCPSTASTSKARCALARRSWRSSAQSE